MLFNSNPAWFSSSNKHFKTHSNRAMKFMRRGENHLDLEAEAVDLKTKPEQWFREVEELPVKKLGNDASMVECMDLR